MFRSLPSLDGILLNPATAPVPDDPSAFGVIVFPGSAISQQDPRRQSQSARHPGVAVQRARVGVVGRKGARLSPFPHVPFRCPLCLLSALLKSLSDLFQFSGNILQPFFETVLLSF